jgi:hypothetical protein
MGKEQNDRDKYQTSLQNFAKAILDGYLFDYWRIVRRLLNENPDIREYFPHYIADPSEIIIYLGRKHIAVEYVDNGSLTPSDDMRIEIRDYIHTQNLFECIVNINFDGTSKVKIPIVGTMEHVFARTPKASEILTSAGWDIAAQAMSQSSVFVFNPIGFAFVSDEFASLRDSIFYGTDKQGLVIRHIKWLDAFPIHSVQITNTPEIQISIPMSEWPNRAELALSAVNYDPPELGKTQLEKLLVLNRFIELFNTNNVIETAITSLLAQPEHQFILKIAFNAEELYAEKKLEWVNNPDKQAIKPDFFVTQRNGYADIVDFKLPTIKHSTIVGKENRETFNADIHSHVAQIRTYAMYFEESANRSYAENTHGVKARYPKTWLVIGRRSMFDNETWKEIEHAYHNLHIKTYDDLVDSVTSIIYLITDPQVWDNI